MSATKAMPAFGEGVEDGDDLSLDEVVDAEVVLSRVLEDGEALAAQVLLRGRDPPRMRIGTLVPENTGVPPRISGSLLISVSVID